MHTIKSYSAFKKREVLQYPTAWMNLEDDMLNEISQSQEDESAGFH